MAFNFNGINGVLIVLGALFVVYYIYNLVRGKNKFEDQGYNSHVGDGYGVKYSSIWGSGG